MPLDVGNDVLGVDFGAAPMPRLREGARHRPMNQITGWSIQAKKPPYKQTAVEHSTGNKLMGNVLRRKKSKKHLKMRFIFARAEATATKHA
jgi:hypothetical protein